ncbi:acyltransferase [Acinetobacter ursingii]|uniref:acyltransferase n=1 Tax=Acinetobacter ursingii TaxID=108980 RepID=UPI003AF695C2
MSSTSNKFFKLLNKLSSLVCLLKTQFWYKLFFESIGTNSKIFSPMMIMNPGKISIGNNVLIRDFSRLEIINNGLILIGDNVSIEQGFHMVSATKIEIGKDTTISFHVMIADIEHSYEELDVHILKQNDKAVETIIGENCFIGAGSYIQPGTVLGKQCIIGTNSVVRGKFPDYSVIVGSPAKIVKRYDSTQNVWRKTDGIGNFL